MTFEELKTKSMYELLKSYENEDHLWDNVTDKDWELYYTIRDNAGLIENVDYFIVDPGGEGLDVTTSAGGEKLIKYFLEHPERLNEGLHPAFLPPCFRDLEDESLQEFRSFLDTYQESQED
jgi:hypothetical protein